MMQAVRDSPVVQVLDVSGQNLGDTGAFLRVGAFPLVSQLCNAGGVSACCLVRCLLSVCVAPRSRR